MILILLLIPQVSNALPVKMNCPNLSITEDFDYDIYKLDQIFFRSPDYEKCSVINQNSFYEIKPTEHKPIGSISVESGINEINTSLEAMLNPLIGKSNTATTRQILYDQLLERLESRGFPKPKWTIQIETKELSDNLLVDIQLGEECQIKSVTWPKDIDKLVSDNLLIDEICDTRMIQSQLESVEDSIRSKGYNEVRLRFERIDYFDNKKFANAIMTGSLGEKVSYVVVDQGSGTKIADIFFGESNRIQPRFISPDAVASELRQTYQSKGYMEVDVIGPEKKQKNDTIVYTWRVNSGRKNSIRNLNFDGLNFFKKDVVLPMFSRSIFGSLSGYSVEEFNSGIEALLNLYRKNGFLDAKIKDPRFSRVASTDATDVTVFIEEGLQYKITSIKFDNNQAMSESDLLATAAIKPGDVFDRAIFGETQNRLKNLYNSRGYAHIGINISTRNIPQRKFIGVVINIQLDEGPLVKIGKIAIIGLSKTEKSIVEREVDFGKGATWDPNVIENTRRKIASIGIFKSVNIVATDPNAFDRRTEVLDLSIIVKESKPGTISFGPGYDLSKGFRYVAEGSYNNLFGTARRVSVRAGFSEEKQQTAISDGTLIGRKIGFGYVEPWLFTLPLSGKISAAHSATATNFWQFNNQIEGEVSWQLSRLLDTKFSVFIRNEMNKDVGSNDQRRIYEFASGNTRKGVAGLRMAFDGRDSIAFPTRGIYLGVENSVADFKLGGEYKFHSVDVNGSFYHAFRTQMVYALGITWGKFWDVDRKDFSYGSDILPASDWLQAGGSELIRGFEKQLGPYVEFTTIDGETNERVVGRAIIGGTNRLILKQELRFRTTEDSSLAFQIDSGNTWLSDEGQKKLKARFQPDSDSEANANAEPTTLNDNYPLTLSESFKNPINYSRSVYWSTGFSYNLFTPVGALRIGVAIPFYEPRRCTKEKENCLLRSKNAAMWYGKSQLDLSVGTKF